MAIKLSRQQIEDAVPCIKRGLDQYICLQKRSLELHFCMDKDFRRRFNHFYRVRRNPEWQDKFYKLMEKAKLERLSFECILQSLHTSTGRYEASFASKLFATINPTAPVIDSVVLKNVGLRLPRPTSNNRKQGVCDIHHKLTVMFREFLATENGRFLVRKINLKYNIPQITGEKKLDLVLWQLRF